MEALYIALGVVIGFLAYKFFIAKNLISPREIEKTHIPKSLFEEYENKMEEKEREIRKQFEEIGRLKTENENALDLQKNFSFQFENMASKLLEEKNRTFAEQNKTNIETLLKPFKVDIERLNQQIADTNDKSIKQHSELGAEIRMLIDLSAKMKGEAENLANALKGNKQVQGEWGEALLERILEISGLKKDIHYFAQENVKTEEGRDLRPDIIVRLPDKKTLVIDSKVSLNDYVKYTTALNNGDPKSAEEFLKQHIKNIEDHIKRLSDKQYQNLHENTPDFVVMFIGLEPALFVAMQKRPGLQGEAMEKKVLLTSTTLLFPVLKTVAALWQNDDRNKNALEIAQKAGKLYDKFVGFSENLLSVGHKIRDAQTSYESAMGQLSKGKDNLVRQVEKIKELGAKTEKEINQNLLERAKRIEE